MFITTNNKPLPVQFIGIFLIPSVNFRFSPGYLSLTLFLTPARIPDSSPPYLAVSRRTSRTWQIWTVSLVILAMCVCVWQTLDSFLAPTRCYGSDINSVIKIMSSTCGIQTWPFLRILARLNFSLFLTLGLRSIFFLFGVSPLFLAICEFVYTHI